MLACYFYLASIFGIDKTVISGEFAGSLWASKALPNVMEILIFAGENIVIFVCEELTRFLEFLTFDDIDMSLIYRGTKLLHIDIFPVPLPKVVRQLGVFHNEPFCPFKLSSKRCAVIMIPEMLLFLHNLTDMATIEALHHHVANRKKMININLKQWYQILKSQTQKRVRSQKEH